MTSTDRPLHALVTGGAGFMGSHVADSCLAMGMETIVTDDLSGGFIENVPANARWLEGDLRDAQFVETLWSSHGPFDYVYHLGAYAAEGLSHFIRSYNYRTNLEASTNLINQAIVHEAKCFVFTSSIAVYGAAQVPMTEGQTPQPEDPYGISKYAVELDLRAAHEMFGLDYIVFRPHNVYGERQNIADRYRNVIGIFMNAILSGRPMPVFGDGLQSRAFSYIGDVAPLIARSPLMSEARNEVFNIGADRPYSIVELARVVSDALDAQCSVEHLPPRNEVAHAFSDHSKLQRVFGSGETVDLETGIRMMAEWVKISGAREPVEFAGQIEVSRELPPSWGSRQAPKAQAPSAGGQTIRHS